MKGNESEVSAAPSDGGHTGLPAAQVVKGAKIDLWDSNWSGGRYYWTVMPINAVPATTITTTLANAALAGDTSDHRR